MNRFRPNSSFVRLVVLVGLACLASCASHTGQFSASTLSGPVEYRSVAIGRSSVTKVLGFGGTSRKNLLLEARNDMLQSHPLKDGESFVNTALDINQSNYLLFSTTTFTLSADVVASLTDNAARVYSREYSRVMGLSDSLSSFPATGDTVMTENGKPYLLVTRSSDGSAGVIALPDDGKFRISRLPLEEVFAIHGDRSGVSMGDTLTWEMRGSTVPVSGRVVGLGAREVLVEPLPIHVGGDVLTYPRERFLYGEIELDAEPSLVR